jgi:hypothetical protein
MTVYFVGGAAGSGGAGVIYARWGWMGVCLLGLALAGSLIAVWTWDLLWPPPLVGTVA